MPGLSELQADFTHHVLAGESRMLEYVTSDRDIPAELRLAVYANAYRARLVETLGKDFPALQHCLGKESFTELAHDYIAAHPSRYFSLRWFGEALPEYLAAHARGRTSPALAELARLEWAFVDAFDAPDVECATESDAAAIPPEAWPTLGIGLHPSVQLVAHHWDVLALLRAGRDDEPIPTAQRMTGERLCLIWRQGLDARYRALQHDEAAALRAVHEGADFSALCEALAAHVDDPQQAALRAATLLKTWLGAGLIAYLICARDRETAE